jgi:hypothetical protein
VHQEVAAFGRIDQATDRGLPFSAFGSFMM